MSEILTVLDDDSLYERYGKPLEQEHQGKYIAISRDGQVIVDADDAVVVDQAIERFGSGNFMFHRIGYSYVWTVRGAHAGQHRGVEFETGTHGQWNTVQRGRL